MEFQILGPLEVDDSGRSIAVGGPRERTALAMLLLEANHVIPVHRLIDAVWDEDPPATARGQIQICISSLRRRLQADDGADRIITRSPGYLLHVEDGSLDVQQFEARVAEGRARLADGDPQQAAQELRAALALWRGPALSGIDSKLVQPGATRLNERRLVVLGECLDCELSLGGHHEVIGELAELVDQHPLRENFRGLLMTALYRAGRQAEALETYRSSRAVLMEELGIEPGDELRRLHQSILASTYEAKPAERAAPPTPTRPDPAAPARRPRLLPASIPDFTGRREIVDRLVAQMTGSNPGEEAEHALGVSVIVGQGGAGKTTLAVHVAHLLAPHFPDGQLFARMRTGDSPVGPTDILERFLRALGVSGPALPDSADERAELFRDLLGGRRVLIVLDDAVTEQQVTALLPGNADCSVIVTSRRRLTGLPSVARVEIGAFSLRSATELLTRIVGPARIAAEPDGVAELCRLCGNLPLALRIVAARLAARPQWTVADLVERLTDESHRLDELHHGEMGVRASISLTYDGLSTPAKVLFGRLALLECPSFASWVAAPLMQIDVPQAQDVLEELAEAYLIDMDLGPTPGAVRYRLHDIMRPFARERLAEESVEDRRAALERWFGSLLTLTGEAHRREYSGGFLQQASSASRWSLPDSLISRLMADPLGWFEQERASIVAAVRQAAATGLAEHSWSLALNAVTLFESHSYLGDWAQTHEIALRAARKAGDRRGEATMRYSIGSLHMFEQRFDLALGQFEQAYDLFAQMSDRHGMAMVQRNRAFLDRTTGDLDSALSRGEEALATFRALGDHIAEAHVLQNLAEVRILYGDEAAAHQLLERAGSICDQLGNRRVGAQVQHRLGNLLLSREDLDGAHAAYTRAMASVRESGDQVGEAYVRLGLASVALRRGDAPAAERILQVALDLSVSTGERMTESQVLLGLAEAALVRGHLEAAGEQVERSILGFEDMGAELLRARALNVRGRIQLVSGCPQSATLAWRQAQDLLSDLKLRGATTLSAELERSLAELPGGVGSETAGPPPGQDEPTAWHLSA